MISQHLTSLKHPTHPMNHTYFTSHFVALSACLVSSLACASENPPRTTTLDPITVIVDGNLAEEQLIGPYQQPEWTSRRRFGSVRTYVLPPWQVETESWWRPKVSRGDHDLSSLFQQEIEIGLPGRFMLDFYLNFTDGDNEEFKYMGEQYELRYALADWGKLLFNPTIYLELKNNRHGPNVYEIKLLLADDFGPRWHWGVNLAFEQETGGEIERVLGLTSAVSYTVIDQVLSVGLETKYEAVNVHGARSDYAHEFGAGPSLQWRPTKHSHLDLVGLFGITDDAPAFAGYMIFGIDLGRGGEKEDGSGYAPISARSN